MTTRADLIASVAATGTIDARNKVEVGAELSGLIREVDVDFNTPVTKGQVLAVFDANEYEAQVVQSRADLKAAEAAKYQAAATLKEAQGKLDRARELQRLGWVAPQAAETAKASYDRAAGELDASTARIALAAATLDLSLTKLGKTKILAPMDGTVLDRLIEPGQVVVAALQTPRLFTIVGSLREMTLTAAVSEADIAAVAIGQTTRFTVDSYPQRSFLGTVTQIRNAPRKVDGVVTYDVVVAVPNQELLLKPGMTATAEIVTARDLAVLQVPNAALRFTPPGQIPYHPEPTDDGARRGEVWVMDGNGQVKPVPVQLGPSDGRMTEIVGSALSDGQAVLTSLPQEAAS